MKAMPLKEPRSDSPANFIAVHDSRNRKLRGLWIRGNRYCPQGPDEHKREMAARLVFSPRVFPLEASGA